MEELILILLLLTANGSPILARHLLGNRWSGPIDASITLADGHRLLGASKTWRGLAAALVTTPLVAIVFDWQWKVGLVIGATAMLGDALSSFVKRRLGMPSSAMAPGLDHIPESFLPLLVCKPLLLLSWFQVVLLSLGFMVTNLLLSRWLHRLGIRRHPY